MNQEWNRAVLKQRAKNVLKTTYWQTFAVCLIVALLAGQVSLSLPFNLLSTGDTIPYSTEYDPGYTEEFDAGYGMDYGAESMPDLGAAFAEVPGVVWVIVLAVIGFAILFSMAFQLFVSNPLRIGQSRFLYYNSKNPAKISTLFSAFSDGNYIKTVGKMAVLSLIDIAIALPLLLVLVAFFAWLFDIGIHASMLTAAEQSVEIGLEALGWVALLLIGMFVTLIASTIVSLMLMPLPFIIAENPTLSLKRAFSLARQMTRGHKARIFVLSLSFIGWELLGVLACGIGTLFVAPYIQATYAELYGALRWDAVQKGLCTADEIGAEYFV